MTVLTVLHTLWVTVIRTTRIQVATHCTTTCTLGGGDTNVISAPMIQDIDQGGLMVKFWARTSSTSYPGGFDVVMTDAMGNYETARTVQSISLNGNTSYQEFQVYLDSNAVQTGDKRVGFRMYSKALLMTTFISTVYKLKQSLHVSTTIKWRATLLAHLLI